MTYTQQVPAAERTLHLLEALVAAPQGLSAAELMDQLNITRSSLFALLNTLKARNYVEQTEGRRYRPGPALFGLIPSQQRSRQALIDAFQADAELGLLGESAALTRLDGPETVVIAARESSQTVRAVLAIGQRRPAATTADGLALLAGLPAGALERSQPQNRAALAQVRQNGLAQTQTADVVELACPICPDGIQPDSALLLAVPAYRFGSAAGLAQGLRSAAARLSLRLGAPMYRPYGHINPELVEPAAPLEPDELARFLYGAWGARLACVRGDGSPHVVPLWYEWDGQFFWVTASPSASWAGYLREHNGVALTIDEPWPPLRRALISGEAAAVPAGQVPGGGLAALRRRMAARYLGEAGLPAPESDAGWAAFKITPKKIIGQRGLVK